MEILKEFNACEWLEQSSIASSALSAKCFNGTTSIKVCAISKLSIATPCNVLWYNHSNNKLYGCYLFIGNSSRICRFIA